MILDGSWFVFRAYYALPELHDSEWNNVNAVFGFFRMLLKLLDQRPTHFVIARDSPVKTIRKEQFETYKANRVSMPDEFKWQMRKIKELIDEVNIPALQVDGYEADDIIATLVMNTNQPDAEVRIVSADKDIKQLIRAWVVVYDPAKDLTTDTPSFLEEFGFWPEQLLDYLALVGDSSDNVPGVSGIWPKTATELIKRFGSIDGIYAHLDDISAATAQKLRVGQLQGQESKQLVTLMTVPTLIDRSLDHFPWTPDFSLLEQKLVDQAHMHSLGSLVHALKKQRQSGEQLSLFG